ncbi:MAG: acyltransferase family protein [Gammaproteobacteria bacterium]
MNYRAEIDGLRALAVVPVIFYHAGFDTFSGGYVGVDVFFVISGYLITTLLIEDLKAQRFGLARFYERRARRILPALTLVLVASLLAGWRLMSPIELASFGNGLLGAATFTSNIVFWKSQGYFTESSELNPIIHTWSLAVEEQYYLLFPVFLAAVWKWGAKRIVTILLALAVLSLCLSEVALRVRPSANFYLAPTRVWELFAGSITAFLIQRFGVRANDPAAFSGVLAILFAVFVYNDTTPFPSVYALLPVLGTVLIVLFAGPQTRVRQLLSVKVLVGLGLLSYSAYLWHQPLFAFTRLHLKQIELPAPLALALIVLTILLSYASWKWVETPARGRRNTNLNTKLKSGRTPDRESGTTRTLGITAVALFALGAAGWISKQPANGYEHYLARVLSVSDQVYYGNMDDRKFIEGRLVNSLDSVHTVVMGSSRLMELGSRSLGETVLNVSVSAASVEDYLAFTAEAVAKLHPDRVVLGADPWLFNANGNQERWQSSKALFEHWRQTIANDVDAKTPAESSGTVAVASGNRVKDAQPFLDEREQNADQSLLQRIFQRVNTGEALVARDTSIEAVAKKTREGAHVYNTASVELSPVVIRKAFDALLNYSMEDYTFDTQARETYVGLIRWLQSKGIQVTLVLAPYHPELYARMKTEAPVFADTEQQFITLANELNIDIAGSHNPDVIGCSDQSFYDGMHAKVPCLTKALQYVPEQ